MAKEKKELYEDDLGHLSFKDSWLQDTVQLAALGGILAGTGALAVHGDLGEAFRNNKSVFHPVGKAFDKYVKANAKMPLKFGYQVFKNMFGNLQKMTPENRDATRNSFRSMVENAAEKVDTDPEIKKRIRKEVKRRFASGGKDDFVDDVLDGTNKFKDIDNAEHVRTLYEQVRGEERNRLINGTPFGNQDYRNNNFNNNNRNNQPLFNKRDLAQKFIANGVAGIGLGAGLTGFHYIDRLSKDPNAQNRLENAYHRTGSFLNPSKKDDDKKMDKQASALGFYNALKEAPKKFPEALFAGAGYTGVTLGTAKLLKKNDPQNQQQPIEEDKPNGPRVIIELGNDPSTNNEHHNMGMPLGLSGLPKLAGLQNFWNDFKGHEAEIENLRNIHHPDEAAEALKGENIGELLKNQYGNLVNDQTRSNFTNHLFESRAEQSKREADEKIRQLQEQTAKAHLTAIGGGLGAGATGLAGIGYAHHQKEQKQNV